jgi:hypothetical protein
MATSITTETFQLGGCRLTVQHSGGPRILQLQPDNGPALFAETPQSSWETPYGTFSLRGGHRLWAAPEAFPRSYIPDDTGPAAVFDGRRITLSGALEPTGLKKVITVESPAPLTFIVTHQLENCGLWPIECAPWAITQLQPGGTALIPLRDRAVEGLLPDRTVRFWPYSSPADTRIRWSDDFVGINSAVAGPPAKLGTRSGADWLAYLHQQTLFIKRGRAADSAPLPHGCNLECYFDRNCLELETVSPLSVLAPGASVTHQEIWLVQLHVEITTFEEFHQLSTSVLTSHVNH